MHVAVGAAPSAAAVDLPARDARLRSDAGRLQDQIGHEAAAAARTLNRSLSRSEGGYLPAELAERRELRRQLAALRDNVSEAHSRSGHDPGWWRAELATLLSFARTLRCDAEAWRARFDERLRGIALDRAAARRARARSTAERAPVIRRRDDLQSKIDQTAMRIADETGGEHRRTFPCIALDETVTVCSVWVLRPRSRPWPAQRWLVTLDGAHDQVLVRRCYA